MTWQFTLTGLLIGALVGLTGMGGGSLLTPILVFLMFLGSGPMSLLGVALATGLTNRYGDGVQSVEAYAIGAALVIGGIGLVAKTLIKLGMQPDDAAFI